MSSFRTTFIGPNYQLLHSRIIHTKIIDNLTVLQFVTVINKAAVVSDKALL
jgi:hypothetical protein